MRRVDARSIAPSPRPAPGGLSARRAAKQLEAPAPGHQSQRHLQAAGPVDAHAPGVGGHPGAHAIGKHRGIPFVAGETVGLSQMNQPLVAIELPDDLAVSDHVAIERIPIRLPSAHERPNQRSGHGVEMPVDRLSENEVAVAEEIEKIDPPRHDLMARTIGCGRRPNRRNPGVMRTDPAAWRRGRARDSEKDRGSSRHVEPGPVAVRSCRPRSSHLGRRML